jgi:predicted nucleic acid-binding protein
MTLVVADTGPLNYLHLIGRLEILPELYGEVLVPPAVLREMAHPNAPPGLRRFAQNPPDWLQVRTPGTVQFLDILDDGEAEAISLAVELKAQRLLIDERDGRRSALALGLHIRGTLGILEEASEKRLLNLAEALDALRKTTFRAEAALYEAALQRDRDRRSRSV